MNQEYTRPPELSAECLEDHKPREQAELPNSDRLQQCEIRTYCATEIAEIQRRDAAVVYRVGLKLLQAQISDGESRASSNLAPDISFLLFLPTQGSLLETFSSSFSCVIGLDYRLGLLPEILSPQTSISASISIKQGWRVFRIYALLCFAEDPLIISCALPFLSHRSNVHRYRYVIPPSISPRTSRHVRTNSRTVCLRHQPAVSPQQPST